MSSPRNWGIGVEAQMTLERLEGTTCVQTVTVSSQSDGSLLFACAGKLPGASWEELGRLRWLLRRLAEITEQELVVTNDDTLVVRVARKSNGRLKVSFRWLAIARQLLFGNR